MNAARPWCILLTWMITLPGPLAAQTSIDAIYEFAGSTSCSSEDLDVTSQPGGATYSAISRGSSITCVNATAFNRSESFSGSSTINPETSTSYLAFTIDADAGSDLELDAGDYLSLRARKYTTGANHGPRRLSVYYRRDSDATFTQVGGEVTTSTLWTTHTFSFSSLVTVSAGGYIEFRLFGYNADGAQDLGLDDVQLVGFAVLPVELYAFAAHADGDAVQLTWSTASETNNAGFEVQHDAAFSWRAIAFVAGHGTTEQPQTYTHRIDGLAPGVHTFRLKQIDFDGTVEFSTALDVVVAMNDRMVVEPVYPNPLNPEARLRFAVRRSQQVHVHLFDMLGRQVAVLFDGTPEAGQMQEVLIDGSTLPSGLYVVRVVGTSFTQAQSVTLIR